MAQNTVSNVWERTFMVVSPVAEELRAVLRDGAERADSAVLPPWRRDHGARFGEAACKARVPPALFRRLREFPSAHEIRAAGNHWIAFPRQDAASSGPPGPPGHCRDISLGSNRRCR